KPPHTSVSRAPATNRSPKRVTQTVTAQNTAPTVIHVGRLVVGIVGRHATPASSLPSRTHGRGNAKGGAMTPRVGLLLAIAMSAGPAFATDRDVVISGKGWSLPATLELPAGGAPGPCVVFFAGSGPTDRDWLSPLILGKNGSGRQLADALAARGVGSLRFDKVGSGTNMQNLSVLSLDHYADEGEAAFEFLAKRPECTKVYLLGHSEGSMHAFATAARKT